MANTKLEAWKKKYGATEKNTQTKPDEKKGEGQNENSASSNKNVVLEKWVEKYGTTRKQESSNPPTTNTTTVTKTSLEHPYTQNLSNSNLFDLKKEIADVELRLEDARNKAETLEHKSYELMPGDLTYALDLDEINEERKKVLEEVRALEAYLAEYKELEKYDSYTKEITSKEDYEQNSVFSPITPKTPEQLKSEGYRQDSEGVWYKFEGLQRKSYTGEDEDVYTYINDESKRSSLSGYSIRQNGIDIYTKFGYDQLTDDEKGAYNYLYHQDRINGTNTADEYLKKISPALQKRAMKSEATRYAEVSKEAPAFLSAVSVGTNFANSLMFPTKIAATATGTYDNLPLIDTYGNQTQAIRGSVGEDLGYVGNLLYNGAMSIADMGMAIAAGGGNSKIIQFIMSSSAGSSTISNAKNSGASDGKALMLGLGSAAIEWATERYSVEAILSEPATIKGFLAKNIFIESSEEGASNLANVALDTIVSKVFDERSEIERRVDQLIVYDGKTPAEALQTAFLEKAQSLGEDVFVGGITGFGMAGAKVTPIAVSNAYEKHQNKNSNIPAVDNKNAPDTLEKAAMDVVVNRNAQESTGEPTTSVNSVDDTIPTQKTETVKTTSKPMRDELIQMRMEAMSKANEPVTVDEIKKATGYGENGAKLVADIAKNEGITFEQAKNTVETAYIAGRTNLPGDKVNFVTDTQIDAYTAGKQDRLIQDMTAKENVKNATVYNGEVNENDYFQKLSSSDRKQHYQIAKDLGLSMDFVDKLVANEVDGVTYEANAQHEDGKYVRSDTSENKAHIDVVHEAFHRMKQVAPEETRLLLDAIYDMVENTAGVSAFENIKSEHEEAGITKDTDYYLEELGARTIPTLFKDADAWNSWRKKLDSDPSLRSTWDKIIDFIKELIDKAKTYLSQVGMTAAERASARNKIQQLEHIKELYANAYRASRDTVVEIAQEKSLQNEGEIRVNEDYTVATSHSLKRNVNDIENDSQSYSEKDYNSFGWARANNVLNAGQNADYRSKFADAKAGRVKFNRSKNGEYIIPVSDIYDTTFEGIDNVLVFAKGTISNPIITSVIEIYEYDETSLDKVRRRIYELERRGIQQKTTELFRRYDASDFRMQHERDIFQIGGDSDGNGHGRRSGTETEAVKDQSKISYSLKKPFRPKEDWHTGLTKAQIKIVNESIRRAGSPEANRITDTACWYKGRIDGEDLFVIYSTEDADGPTILYESKGNAAKAEINVLQRALGVIENERSAIEKSRIINELFSGDWVQEKHNLENNNDRLGEVRSNTGYASILQGESSEFIGSPAFRNVVKNLFDIQESAAGGKLNKSHSLKGSTLTSESIGDILDIVGDMQTGKKDSAQKLSKYVDNGLISTEKYEQLIERYGAIPKGESPHREVRVPRKTADDKKVSQTVRTILEANVTPDEAVPTIEKMVEDGVFSYNVYTDKQAISDAESDIQKHGWVNSLDTWKRDVEKGKVSKENAAMGWALYNNAANIAATSTSESERTTAIQTSLQILDAMIKHQRSAAQALQATRILKKLSPETQLYSAQKSVQALQDELVAKYKKKAPELKINEELAAQFLQAETQNERDSAMQAIYKDIGKQVPSTFLDKWNAWRYLAMLGNPRTHIRNIAGNAAFAPIVLIKDLTATAIESAVYRVSGKKMVRGKALIVGSKADQELLKAAWSDYANVADMVSNGGKYNDSAIANQSIEAGREIFTFKPLELARKGNSKLLEAEDVWFAKPHYAYALAQYCKANNISAEQIKKGKAIEPAREYAIKEAQKATYKDTNAFSQFVSNLGRYNSKDNKVMEGARVAIEGTLPFRKTPANMLVRGVEYSPLALVKGLTYDLVQVSKGKMSATEAIDNISAGLTGTGLVALGVYLAAQGLIRGFGGDDKDEKKFKELVGHQSYALELPNGESITLDWLAPEALPFFVGVNIWESTKGSKDDVNLSSILKAVSNITEPMLEMSCLQSLNDLFESVGYASSNNTSGLISVLLSAATNYLTQGIPTLLGQAERSGESVRMTTYTEKNDFLTDNLQYTLGKISAKIPFWDYNQIPYIDAWGRKEASGTALKRGFNNFLNPAYTSEISDNAMEKELLRLYDLTGETSVFPERADKYFTVDGKRKDLTAEEYVRYATLKGEKSYKLISDLVHSKAYKKLDDGEKIKAIEEAYDYANQKAKKAISNYKPDSWVSDADEFGSNVGNYLSFKANISDARTDNGGKISKQEVVNIITDMSQSDSEAWCMYLSMYDSAGDHYAHDNGISGKTYMDFLDALNKADKPTESGVYGTYTQDEATAAIKNLKGLSQKEKAVLWQSVNPQWKEKNNSFR